MLARAQPRQGSAASLSAMAKAPDSAKVGATCPRCEQRVEVEIALEIRLIPPVPMSPHFPADADVIVKATPGLTHDCPGRAR